MLPPVTTVDHDTPTPAVRPVALAPRFVVAHALLTAVPTLLLALVGASAAHLAATDLQRLAEQEAVYAEGTLAAQPRVRIERDLSVSLFRARRYEVSFHDAQGRQHAAQVREHDLSVAPLLVEGPPQVHYDERNPSRVSVSFARQNVPAQEAAITLLGTVGAVFFALAAWAAAHFSRRLRRAWAAARTPLPGSARVVKLERSYDAHGEPTGELHLVLAGERSTREPLWSYRAHEQGPTSSSTDARRRTSVLTPATDPPIFLDAGCTRVLVAATRSGHAVLVRRSGHPFVLDEVERARWLERVSIDTSRADSSPG